MGFHQAVACFDRWANKVQNTIYNSQETQAIKRLWNDFEKTEWAIKTFRKYCYLALDEKYKKPTDNSINELLTSNEWEMSLTPVYVPSRIKSPMPPSDPNYLKELTQSNPAIRELMDSFELKMDDDAVLF